LTKEANHRKENDQQQQQPNINATSLFQTGRMVLGDNVKNLLILIPNEGHHEPNEEEES
jgi:predicted transcriptional regulator